MKNIILYFLLFFSLSSIAQIRLPKLISDDMVLQRDKPVKVWGWASPNEKITLTLNTKNTKPLRTMMVIGK